ncbi:hypothetical protein L9F63_027250, partial [Diploptera punctata]
NLLEPSPSTSTVTPLSPQDHHRALDELLNDMLLTVENIPDLPPTCGNIPPAKQLNNGYGANDTSAPGDDTETDDNIPYHARQDSRPFTYGMLQMHPGLASPSLVRKASFRTGTTGTPKGSPVSSTATLRQSPLITSAQPSPPEEF